MPLSHSSFDAKVERDWLFGGVVDATYLAPEKSKPATKTGDLTDAIDGFTAVNCEHWVRTLVNSPRILL